ncbi:MAG: ribokinase [Lachnospiraceae bacterium]|nr:ribokinase [Lachnospiraceae bacterium]
MNKRNYQKELEQIIERQDGRPTLLLHGCCAPCSSYVLEYLNHYFQITLYDYNPNISPQSEYEMRTGELLRLTKELPMEYPAAFQEGPYDPERFFAMAKGLEREPEGGARCKKCYELRLVQAVKVAEEQGFDYVTTTLTISPLKHADWLNEIGERLTEQTHVKWLPSDFKKKNGYKRSIELSAEYGLYRQNYCGCVFSKEQNRRRKIAVVGSINMDTTVLAERIPLAGETVYGENISDHPGGKGANQAVAMARLGADVTMFGCVGADENGRKLLENLKENGVHTEQIQVLSDVSTGLALITVAEQDNTIIIVAGANERADETYVERIKEQLKQFDLVVLQHEIPLAAVASVIRFCADEQIPIILNPAPAACVPMELVERVTYLTPNEHEAALIFGADHTEEELLGQYPEKLIITQGIRGVSFCKKDGTLVNVPARKSQVVDTTGAGDTLNGAFAVRIAKGDSLEAALQYANVAAGLSVEKMGAQGGMPTAAEVAKGLREWRKEGQ